MPTCFAMDNDTSIIGDNSNYTDYYFDASIENDTGDGSQDNPYKTLTSARIHDDSNIYLANGEYNLDKLSYIDNVNIIGSNPEKTIVSYCGIGFRLDGPLTLTNVTFVYLAINTYTEKLTATNVIFKGYSSSYYSLVMATGGCLDFNNCTFTDNSAYKGGAISMEGGKLTVKDSTFTDNKAIFYGGAISCEKDSYVEINNSKFINSQSSSDAGGAIYLFNSTLKSNNIEITNCSAIFGGSITSINSEVSLTNLTSRNNKAKYYGGSIYGMYHTLSLVNSTLINNSASLGGALFAEGIEVLYVHDNYFANNTAEVGEAVFSRLSDCFYDSLNDPALHNEFINNNLFESKVLNLTFVNDDYLFIKSDINPSGILPSYYDLRDLGQVSPVKNQGNGGNCWAFSAIAALESSILKACNVTYDLSEENMKNIMSLYSSYGWAMETNVGGYDKMAIGYLTGWLGPVNESDDAYDAKSILSPLLTSFIHVQNIAFLTRDSYTDNDAIKKAIMEYGAVSTSVYWSSNNANGKSYYYNGNNGPNHAVVIVGWDDNYDKSNFKKTPEGNGAWIIKNSWGSAGGENGFYYVSYYDTKFAQPGRYVSYAFILNDTIKFDKIYQYDVQGKTDYFLNTTSTVWYKNKFIATSNEYLAGVSTYFEKDTSWDLSIYVNNALKLTQSGKSTPSYSTINLDKLISLNKGDTFEIVFKITVDGDAGVPISESISLNQETYSEGISFISYDGKKWVDFYELEWLYPNHTYNSQVASIKAFTIFCNNLSVNFELSDIEFGHDLIAYITINDQMGNIIIDDVNLKIDDRIYSLTVSDDKFYTIPLKLDAGAYQARLIGRDFETISSNFTISKSSTNLDLAATTKGDTVLIEIKVSDIYNDTAIVNIFGKNYSVNIVNGKASLSFDDVSNGNYTVNVYLSNNYLNNFKTSNFEINYLKTYLEAPQMTTYFYSGGEFNITLKDINGHVIPNKEIKILINNETVICNTNKYGIAKYEAYLENGIYDVNVIFEGDNNYGYSSTTSRITVLTSIILISQLTKTYGSYYTFKLLDTFGNPLTNFKIAAEVDGINRYIESDSEGIFSLEIDQDPGNYKLLIINPVNNENITKTIKVVSRISENKAITMYYGAGKYYTVKVFDDDGNIASGVKVTFKINGKTYTKTTNLNGYASLKITQNPATYTITATYKGFNVLNKIVVKPTLILSAKTVKKSKTFKYTVKLLNTNGKILKNKKVTVKFRGKTYKAKTNSKGIATFYVKALSKTGKFTLTATYGSAKITKKITVKK